ncbi:hypothetical protein ACQ7HM_04285 [Williamsia sp. MIQD14]|uniref:hypothetical protein n=1 Tax=Williamsia sp. MIQD14 TaxID=3425703 RepID=UPI003D9FCDA1
MGATALAMFAAALLVLAPVFFPLSWTLAIAAAFAEIVLLIIYLFLRWKKSLRSRLTLSSAPTNTSHLVADASSVASALSTDQARMHLRLLSRDRALINRMSERVEVGERELAVTSSVTMSVGPEEIRKQDIIPVLFVPRGQLAHDLNVFDSGEVRISTVTRDRLAVHTVASIQRLAMDASVDNRLTERPALNLTKFANNLSLSEILTSLLTSDTPNEVEDVQKVTSHLVGVSPDLLLAAEVVRTLAQNYAIGVEACRLVPESNPLCKCVQHRFTTRQQVIPRPTGVARSNPVDVIRKLTGVNPPNVYWSLDNAAFAQSYHLQVVGPGGTYLGVHDILDKDRPNAGTASLVGINGKVQKRLGQTSSQIYFRGTDRLEGKILASQFYERIPGSVGVASIIALAALMLIGISMWIRLGNGSASGTDLVAALLAFPAASAAWLGITSTNRLVGDVLISKVSSTLTIICSLAACCVYLFANKDACNLENFVTCVRSGDLSIRGWAILFSIQAVNCVTIIGTWMLRGWVQYKLLTRSL